MTRVLFWAINGIGAGHTSRCATLAHACAEQTKEIAFLVESQWQRSLLTQEFPNARCELATRFWKGHTREAQDLIASQLRQEFSNHDVVVADLGSIPPVDVVSTLKVPGTRFVFLLRWMSRDRWTENVARINRLRNATVIVTMPRSAFSACVGADETDLPWSPSVLFPDGYVFRLSQSGHHHPGQDDDRQRKIAFTCGMGGVHSSLGSSELQCCMDAFTVSRRALGDSVTFHALTGRNEPLAQYAKKTGAFDAVLSFDDLNLPDWQDYSTVVGRPSFNTVAEVMQSDAAFITAPFESYFEFSSLLYRYLEQFGVETCKTVDANAIAFAIVKSCGTKVSAADLVRRRKHFRNATTEVAAMILYGADAVRLRQGGR